MIFFLLILRIQYAVTSQIELHGLNVSECLILMKPTEGEHLLNESAIEKLIDQNADTTSLILLPGLQYYTGQWIDVPRLTAYAQSKGIVVGVDLAHSVGNIPVRLDEWNVDFACWCTYKYMCSGPGGFGGIYVNKRHTSQTSNGSSHNGFIKNESIKNGLVEKPSRIVPTNRPIPALKGWWGNKLETKFNMAPREFFTQNTQSFKISSIYFV